MIPRYVVILLIFALFSLTFTGGALWQHGRESDKTNQAILKAQEKYNNQLKILEARKSQREIVYRDRERIINADTSVCFNTDLPIESQRLLSVRPNPAQ